MKWIQWLLDNAWTVIIVGTVLVQMFQAIFKKKAGDADAPEAEQPKEYEFEDPELAERTRKIREEIQRKIEQRARGYTETPQPTSVPEPEAPPPLIHETVPPAAVATAYTRVESQRHAEILEQQAAWEEKLLEAQRMKAAIQKRTSYEAATADQSAVTLSATRNTVLGDLKNPEALRRAFILREVLGPPVALRQ